MALYEPQETDTVYETEGIKFVLDDEIVKFTEVIEIIYGPSYFGNTFLVKL
jgi:Fe-S cluster assembly iron-binding protein IscA